MSELSRNYDLEIEVLSPVHIGKGARLQREHDFITQRGITYRLNDQAIWDEFWPDDPKLQQQMLSRPVSDLIRDKDLSRPESKKYVLGAYRGDPGMNEIYEHIKDVFGHAYIPGSSLKGALRTLLMRTIIEGVAQQKIERKDIGYAMRDGRDAIAAKSAASRLEARYAGADPNHSLFRGLAISDTQPTESLSLQRVSMAPKLEVAVEAIPMRTRLQASMRLDRYILVEKREELGFEKAWANALLSFARAANFTAKARIDQELRHHLNKKQDDVARFYAMLLAEMTIEFEKSNFFLQVGFATGWRSKTLIGGLKDDDPLLDQVVNDFHLDAGGKRGGAEPRQPGDPFPKMRHLAMINDKPVLPMGWVKVSLEGKKG